VRGISRLILAVTTAGMMIMMMSAGVWAAPRWSGPTGLSSGNIALVPEAAVAPSGDALVVWDQEVGGACPSQPDNPACVHVVEAASRAPGTLDWRAPVEIMRPGVDSRPNAALDRRGDGLVLWVHDIGEDRALQASYRSSRTGTWPEPLDVSEITHRIGPHAAALDDAGDVTVLWAGTDAGGHTVVYARDRSAVSGTWAGQVTVSPPDGNVTAGPSLAEDAAGDAVAVWALGGPHGDVVQASLRLASSAVWTSPVDLSTPGTATEPAVAIDGAGDAVAVWKGDAVRSSFRPAGAGWSTPAALSAPFAGDGIPRVAVDAGGNAVAIWLDGGVVRSAARPLATRTWSTPVDIDSVGAGSADLTIDIVGNAVAVWVDASGTTRTALRPSSTGRWLPAVDLSPTGAVTGGARVLATGPGTALVVWDHAELQNARVEAVDLTGGGPIVTSLHVPASGNVGAAIPFGVDTVPWAASLATPPAWSFGDGATASGKQTWHVFTSSGRYRVTVTQVDAAGGSTTVSATVLVVAARLRNSEPPVIFGSPHVGSTLTCTRGRWVATAPVRFSYRWLRGSRRIPGVTARRYRPVAADAGAVVTCRVIATNAAGTRTATAKGRRVHA
jgi:hypothetical protein